MKSHFRLTLLFLAMSTATATAAAGVGNRTAKLADLLGRLVVFTREVLRVQIGDMQEPVVLEPEVDERGLNARFDIRHLADIDVADVTDRIGPFSV